MCKKIYPIASIIVMCLYFMLEIISSIITTRLTTALPAVLFTGVMSLLAVLLILKDDYKKTKRFCFVLSIIGLLCAIIFSVNVFVAFFSYSGYIGLGFSLLLFGMNVGLILINADNSMLINKLTSCFSLLILILLCIPFIDFLREPIVLSVSINLVCAAISLNILASRMKKTSQNFLSLTSIVLLIMPIIYLIRGYWGMNSIVFVKVISIVAVLLSLVCTVIGAVLDIKKCKGEKPVVAPVPAPDTPLVEAVMTSAPVATPVVNLAATETWTCEKCSANNNGDFCENCGAKKTEYWFCTSCGTKNHKQFCGKCGQKKEM